MHLSPDPDFEEFALDCIRLSNQEKSPILRRNLLTLAREWMHAAMHQQGAEIHQESTEPMDENSRPSPTGAADVVGNCADCRTGEPWSDMDIVDLTRSLDSGDTFAKTASFLCRDEDEVRQKARQLGLVEHPGKRIRVVC